MKTIKDLQNHLEGWYGKQIRLTNKIDNVFLREPASFDETFSLKKVSVGEMEAHRDIQSLLIGCDFNKVRSISNITDIEYIEEEQKIKIKTTEEGKPSQIEVTIEVI